MSESPVAVVEAVHTFSSVSEAVEAVANAPETVSKLFALSERLIYGTSYIAAYVVVFPAALLFAAIPKRNSLVRGLMEGACDAQLRAEGMFQ